MGKIAATYADTIIVTDDNPRDEDRLKIIHEILTGIGQEKRSAVICQPDRKQAIATAARLADENSIIALLGKGHENTYIVKHEKKYFSDREEIQKF